MDARRTRLNSGRTMAVGVGVIGVVAVATILAIIFGGGGTGDGGTGEGAGRGTGTGTTNPATQAIFSQQPQRPLRVTIQENDYLVEGRGMDLETLIDLAAKVPAGDGPAVLVARSPSSRAKAEQDLKDALQKKGISNAFD